MPRTCHLRRLPHAAHGGPVKHRLLVRRITEHLLRQVRGDVPALGFRFSAQGSWDTQASEPSSFTTVYAAWPDHGLTCELAHGTQLPRPCDNIYTQSKPVLTKEWRR